MSCIIEASGMFRLCLFLQRFLYDRSSKRSLSKILNTVSLLDRQRRCHIWVSVSMQKLIYTYIIEPFLASQYTASSYSIHRFLNSHILTFRVTSDCAHFVSVVPAVYEAAITAVISPSKQLLEFLVYSISFLSFPLSFGMALLLVSPERPR
jgi:hypothetical protein